MPNLTSKSLLQFISSPLSNISVIPALAGCMRRGEIGRAPSSSWVGPTATWFLPSQNSFHPNYYRALWKNCFIFYPFLVLYQHYYTIITLFYDLNVETALTILTKKQDIKARSKLHGGPCAFWMQMSQNGIRKVQLLHTSKRRMIITY